MNENTSPLLKRKCQPCSGDTPSLPKEKIQEYMKQLSDWELSQDGKELIKNFKLKNFQAVLDFVNKIGAKAEAEDHHPNLYIHSYKKLRVELSTHAIGGLSENDFILAAKIDEITPS
jgi:4a-hydroxytetrahydrobiopterin dehydratase